MRQRPDPPEEVIYRDTGCEVHHACLSCPLPVCKYEEGQRWKAAVEAFGARNEEIRKLAAEGMAKREIGQRYGLSLHTVWKITREGK